MACLSGCCSGAPEDGPLCGNHVVIEEKFNRPISVIYQDFLKSGKIDGKKSALEFWDNGLTFQQLEEFSTSLALDIRDRVGMEFKITNPDKDPVICVIIPNSEKAIVLIMAILKTGAAYLPLDEEYPEPLLLSIIKKFRPILIIADDNGPVFNKHDATKFSDLCPLLTLEELWMAMDLPKVTLTKSVRRASIQPEILDTFPPPDPATKSKTPYPAVILHTRGFKDDPVGVRISHASIINRCLFEWSTLNLKEKQSCSLTTNLAQVDSISQIFSALLKGCTLVIFRRSDFKNLTQFIRDVATRHVNRLVIPYYRLHQILQAIDDDKSGRNEVLKSWAGLRYVVCRGGYIHLDDVVRYFKMFKNVPLCNCNGSAETSGDMIYEIFDSAKDFKSKIVSGRLCMGEVMQNTKIYILNPENAVISDSHQGEVCTAGSCLALGYVDSAKAPDKVANFLDNPNGSSPGYETIFRSGEFGRFIKCKDGRRRLYVEGRDDRIVRQKGHEFHVDDVKPYLEEFPFAKEVYLYVLDKGKPTQEMVGIILIKPGTSPSSLPDSITMERTLGQKIPHWALPDEIMLVSSVPKHYYNNACPCCLLSEFRESREPRANSWERHLVVSPDKWNAGIFLVKAIFKVTSIPVEITIANLKHSFYELGGTSLTTIQLLVYLNKNGYPISLKHFFDTKNLMELITLMAKKNPSLPAAGDETESKARLVLDDAKGRVAVVKKNFANLLHLEDDYTVQVLQNGHKSQVISIIATAYCEKGDLASYNMINYQEFTGFLEEMWNGYLQDNLSLVLIEKEGQKVVGVAICQDFFKLVDSAKASGVLYNVLEFHQEVKGNILLHLPQRLGETLEISWMATAASCGAQKNVKIINMLHLEIIKMAKPTFSGVFQSSSNPLSRALCTDVFGYDIFEDFQINKYKEFDGSRPFHLASDTVACGALYLKLRDPSPPSNTTSKTVIDPIKLFDTVNRKKISGVKYYHS